MNKFRKLLICLILSTATLVTNSPAIIAKSTDASFIKDSHSPSKYQDYTLLWKSSQVGKTLEKVSKGKTEYTYTYNENKNRVSKALKNDIVLYNYDDEARLISETRGDYEFTYQYDMLNSIIGFSLNGISYNYVKDFNLTVIAITDINNKCIARYEYDTNGFVSTILGEDSFGNWVDMSKDSSFIGTLNLIRLHSFYFDTETGWYYNGLQYYDSASNLYIVNTDNSESISSFEEFKKSTVSKSASPTLISQIFAWQNALMNTPSFGTPISFSTGWYNSLSDVEILARLIYGENTANSFDQNSVAWVIVRGKYFIMKGNIAYEKISHNNFINYTSMFLYKTNL